MHIICKYFQYGLFQHKILLDREKKSVYEYFHNAHIV